MPNLAPLSEFNRNQAAVIDRLEETGEPLYLTRHGKAAVVVMSAEAYERAVTFKNEIQAREMEVYGNLLKGYGQYARGQASPASEVFGRLREKKGLS